MTNSRPPDHLLQMIEEWFSGRGYTIALSEEDGVSWAALINATGGMVAPRYGRGRNPLEAAESAKARYVEEQ
jgi:hypothetical protein